MWARTVCAGVSPVEAWEMTWGECAAILRQQDREERMRMRFWAQVAWKTADMIAQQMAPMLVKHPRRPESLQAAFPALFEDEDKPAWMRMRDGMNAVAEQINR